ncbi:MAG: epoxyqueuosine reductase QueH [Lentisphaerae bacterium]|nr:epoxyqueuosine reductase QueH [Lentisphaerota bacterium]
MKKPRLLLHVCCAPCAAHAAKTMSEDWEVTLFFSNSNISPPEEYERRLGEARKLAVACGAPLVEDAHDHAGWLRAVAGFEREPEGGARCERCFAYNLARAARFAAGHGFDAFTTTLSVSPHKNSSAIFRAGTGFGGFLETDFKKRDGFRKSIALARELGLYRQDYCGCEFSLRGKEPARVRD